MSCIIFRLLDELSGWRIQELKRWQGWVDRTCKRSLQLKWLERWLEKRQEEKRRNKRALTYIHQTVRLAHPSREEGICSVSHAAFFWVGSLEQRRNLGRLRLWVIKGMLGCLEKPQFVLIILVALFILPYFSLTGIMAWMINLMVMLPMDKKRLYFSDGTAFWILTPKRCCIKTSC